MMKLCISGNQIYFRILHPRDPRKGFSGIFCYDLLVFEKEDTKLSAYFRLGYNAVLTYMYRLGDESSMKMIIKKDNCVDKTSARSTIFFPFLTLHTSTCAYIICMVCNYVIIAIIVHICMSTE